MLISIIVSLAAVVLLFFAIIVEERFNLIEVRL